MSPELALLTAIYADDLLDGSDDTFIVDSPQYLTDEDAYILALCQEFGI